MSKPKNSVDHVLDRMVEVVLGENAQFRSHAAALGIPRETVKSWKRRGEVSPGYLKGFALDWKVSLDWLLTGDIADAAGVEQECAPYVVEATNAEERALIQTYRQLDPETRITLQNLLKVIANAAPAEVAAPKARPRQLRHAGEVERVSRGSAPASGKKPGRQRGPGDDAQ